MQYASHKKALDFPTIKSHAIYIQAHSKEYMYGETNRPLGSQYLALIQIKFCEDLNIG